MKRWFLWFVAVMVWFTMGGCTGTSHNGESETGSTAGNGQSTQDSRPTPEHSSAKTEQKTLVAYFSATGTTEKIAQCIANLTHADVFVIEPATPYTSEDLDWTNDQSRVSLEHNDPDGRDVKLKSTAPPDFETYDTVLIGYPIWWGEAAWPVNTFVKSNDFTGKTIVPFCTSASSDIGESGQALAAMAKTGNWKAGKRFYGQSSEEDIRDWLKELAIQ